MYFFKSCLIALVFLIGGCGEFTDDLFPTHSDRRITSDVVETGPREGQKAPEISTVNSLNDSFHLSSELSKPATKAVVLYFAMWCPICNSHLDHMVQTLLTRFPDTKFIVIDYVSGSVKDVRSNVIANGYANTRFSVLADLENSILKAFDATMGTTVVIDSSGVVRMNEDYKDGSKLLHILEALP